MPIDLIVGNRAKDGRLGLAVSVGLCAILTEIRTAERGAIPKPIRCKGMIDTARLVTSVATDVLEGLGLVPAVLARGWDEKGYCVSLAMHGINGDPPLLIPTVHVLAHRTGTLDAAVMLGVDALKGLILTVNGQPQFTIRR